MLIGLVLRGVDMLLKMFLRVDEKMDEKKIVNPN